MTDLVTEYNRLTEEELLDMLNMCSKDESEDMYKASSVRWLAQNVLVYIRELKQIGD